MARPHLERIGIAGRGAPSVAEDASSPRGYPRPLLRRAQWTSLDGRWAFAIDPEATMRVDEVRFDGSIEVPFSPETPRSGVGDTSLYAACWYRREIATPDLRSHERLLLHFGAIDY